MLPHFFLGRPISAAASFSTLVKPITISLLCLAICACKSSENTVKAGPHLPTPVFTTPLFGDKVWVFDPSMNPMAMQQKLDQLHAQQAYSEFSNQRYAILFKPGEYNLEVNVDYYVQAMGLGRKPGDVVINGALQSTASTEGNKVTTMFWRGAENFLVKPSAKPMLWAVSQAAPYRRMHIKGDVQFDKGSWASGGYMANSIVEGQAGLTTGQQWFTRNSELGSWQGGNWNRVFVGVKGAPANDWPTSPTTAISTTPLVRDKPFLTLNKQGDYEVFVPALSTNSRGVSWRADEAGELIALSQFYIAHAGRDTSTTINNALAQGKHLLFTPGLYPLNEAIRINRPNTVVLGLGLPTLIPENGTPAMVAADVGGLKIAGLMFDAGLMNSPVLLQLGQSKTHMSHADNPSSLNDIYCRVGGAIAGQTEVCVIINSNHVIADHFWLWRADHGVGADWQVNKSAHGLVVNGDDVTIYGLFNEHFQHYQTLWNGERGRTYFYQSEIPYKPPSIAAWNDNGAAGFASYKVANHVKQHSAWGLGIYSFFRGEPTVSNNVRLENAAEVPNSPNVHITHIANFAGLFGGINHVINGLGPATEVGELTLYHGVNPQPPKAAP